MKRFLVAGLVIVGLLGGIWVLFAPRNPGSIARSPAQRAPSTRPVNSKTSAPQARFQAAAATAMAVPLPGTNPSSAPGISAPTSSTPPRKRTWDTNFLASLKGIAEGDPIRFELIGGEYASGTIRHLEHTNNEVRYVSGELTAPEPGRFFFQKQSQPGKAGDFVGVVEFPDSQKAYRLEPSGPGGTSELVERPLSGVVCLKMPLPDPSKIPEEIPPLEPDNFPSVPIPGYQNGIIVLESLHGSTPVLYLDFQGGYTPTWGGIAYVRPSISNPQIRDVWERVAEDYMPFNINVTTDLKIYQNAPEGSRQRVVITPTSTAAPGAGGVAYVGSWNWTGDTPCWVFITSGKNCAEACSHEAGHTVGLSHDGQDVNGTHTEYYAGQGSGATGWAPIMGVGYYQNVTEWSKGEYLYANNTQDDLAIITSQNNNVAYRPDDTGSTLATSRYLEIYSNYSAGAEGVIERTGDTDAFQFTTSGGLMSLRANPVLPNTNVANLAIQASLYDANDSLLVSTNPQTTLWAAIATNLPAGTYTFRVTGAGRNNPLTNGFSSYASLGYYSITGSVVNARLPNRFAIPEYTPNGTVVGVIPANNPNNDPLSYAIMAGNTGNTFAIDNGGTLTVANNSLLDYEALARNTQLAVQFELFVNITDTLNPSFTETNRRVVVGITNVNEPPTLTGFAASVLEHTRPGTVIGSVIGSDPDFFTLLAYSIVGGNSNAMFSIGNQSGAITVQGDLNVATQSVYTLTVMVSDQTPPNPLMAASTVTVTVVPNTSPFRPGTIAYAVYTNISGNLVSALTGSPSFPYDPAFEKQLTLFEGDSNRGVNYGAAIRGYLIPPATGSYTFWIATDDNGELWLSSSTNPAAATRICYISGDGNWAAPRQWNKFASQQSAPISLTAGKAYYIEGRLKQGTGNDNIAAAWQCAGAGITQDVIPGEYLAPYPMNYVPRPQGFTVAVHRDAVQGARLGTVTVTDVNSNDVSTLAIIGGNTAGIFSLDPTNGVLRVADTNALLTTSQSSFVLSVRATDNGVPPRSGTTTITANIVPATAITASTIQQELWYNIGGGTAVSDLTNNAKYPRRPDALRALTSWDSGQNLGDNYGSRIRALLTPATSGQYTFFVASDDSSSLRFSATTNPATATQIAYVNGYTGYGEWTKFSSQKSAAFSLVAGQHYYMESLHKEGGGGDFVQVAWTGPGLTGTNVIASNFLTPVDIEYAPIVTARAIQLPLTTPNGTIVASMAALDSPLDKLAYTILSGNLSNAFSIDVDSGQVKLADNSALATYAVSTFILTIQAQDSGYGGLYPLKTAPTTLTIQVTDPTPVFTWNGAGADSNWSTALNWTGMTAPADNAKLEFSGTTQQTNFNDSLTKAGFISLDNGGFYLTGNPLLLENGLTSTGDNTWALPSSLNKPMTLWAASGTLSLPATLNNNGNVLSLLADGSVDVSGGISGSGGLAKAGAGPLRLRSANGFTGPTTLTAGSTLLNDPAALAASSSIEVQAGAILDATTLANALTIPTGQTLTGAGIVLGPVLVNGTLAPAPALSTLTFSNRLVLAGNTVIEISHSGSPPASDLLRVTDQLVCGGSLTITNIGGPLNSGDTFKVLDASNLTGAFATISVPPLTNGLVWDISRLIIDGTIAVRPGTPIILPVTLNGTNLLLQFKSELGLTYALESATTLSAPTDWTTLTNYPGIGGILTLTVPVDRAPARFFRLRAY